MDKIENYRQIQEISTKIKTYREGFITNFFFGESKCNLLINNSLLYSVDYTKCSFLLYKNDDLCHLYFLSVNTDFLRIALENFTKKYPEMTFVTDIIGTDAIVNEFSMLFEQSGFSKYSKLFRMSRLKNGNESYQELDPRIEYASPVWAKPIKKLLDMNFDKYSEQIPLLEEINQWITEEKIIMIIEKEKIIGLVIFEINGLTSYLRYWFTDPDYRNRKIGSALLRRFFYECRNTKRELFWVITTNENAISRYEHYGFKPELMFDQIVINKYKQ
jgi:ribosomal protein S18 acetylase RimI-like enzyme